MLKKRKVSNFVTKLPYETFKKGHGHLVCVENIYIHSILQIHEYSMRLWHTRYYQLSQIPLLGSMYSA